MTIYHFGHEKSLLYSPKWKVITHYSSGLGLEGMKYIIQIYEGEINGHGEKERLPEEFQYEFEQEMLKHIHELKNELREKEWTQRKRMDSEKRNGLREIYHQRFTNPHSSGVTNQMHSWDLSLSKESTSSKKPPTYQI